MALCKKCGSSMVIIKSNSGAKRCMNCGWSTEDNSYKKKQTNADRIRAMSDEELAEFLVDVETHGYHDQSVSGTLEMIEWLQSEAE